MKMKDFWITHFSRVSNETSDAFVHLDVNDCREILEELNIPQSEGVQYESTENRVFGFGKTILKFYRPGRWSKDAIAEEVQFLRDLQAASLPAVRPLSDVHTWKGIHLLAYQSIEPPFNETPEELDETLVQRLAHLLAKVHKVGRKTTATNRPQFDPQGMCDGCFEIIKRAGYIPKDLEKSYEKVLSEIIRQLSKFQDIPMQRIHGDSYSGNFLWKSGHPIIIDFDDFQMGPTAMDVKLLSFPWRLNSLPESMDRIERREIQQQLVLKYYREENDFPKQWEKVFPLMSCYRDILFDAWFSSYWHEPGFAQEYSDDDITQRDWWIDNISRIEKSLAR